MKTVEFPSQPTADTSRTASRTIWKDCPYDQIANGEKDGIAFMDDFNALPLTPTLTTQIAYGQYKAFAASSNTIINVGSINSVAAPGGNLQLLDGAAASADNIAIAQAYPSYYMSGLTATSDKLWFECRVAISSLVANHGAFFVGLGESNLFTLAGTVPWSSNTGLAITNGGSLIGFKTQMLNTIAGQVNVVISDRATSFTFQGASTAADATMTAAFAFIKLGMVYNPRDRDSKQVRFFANGVEITAGVTAAQLTATTNLKANPLGLMFCYVAGSGVGATDGCWMDWWRCAQLLSPGGN